MTEARAVRLSSWMESGLECGQDQWKFWSAMRCAVASQDFF